MNEALCIAQYFLICRYLGHAPKWPGNYNGWHQVEGQSYAPSLADLHVWAATNEETRGEAFNHGNGDAIAWRFLWTLFGRYFGIETKRGSVSPPLPPQGPDDPPAQLSLAEWARDKGTVWQEITDKYGGNADAFQGQNFLMLDNLFSPLVPGVTFLTTIQKARRFGWKRIDDSEEAWVSTFRSYENAGVLPYPESYQASE